LRDGDLVQLTAADVSPDQPINGAFVVQNGQIHLGAAHSSIELRGLTIDEARDAVGQHLQSRKGEHGSNPNVTAKLVQHGLQAVHGHHVVFPDGAIRLGTYGEIPVAGLTIAQARRTIEAYLERSLERPLVSLDILYQPALRR
jgi:protein involved in polysaccharide export with SLBB domain